MDQLIIKTPAKVNLALAVSSEIQNSKHKISSWMSGIDIFDNLKITKVLTSNSSYKRIEAGLAGKIFKITWPIEKDLVFQAHKALEQYVAKNLPVSITLKKHIPPGRGLGGGSSNAAGILLGIQKLYNLEIPKRDLFKIALDLGSDVPFFLNRSNSIISGTGEKVISCEEPLETNLVIVIPEYHMSTKEIYKTFDKAQKSYFDKEKINQMAKSCPETSNLFNDLVDSCFKINPKIKEDMNAVKNLCSTKVHLTGSGSSFFLLAQNKSEGSLWANNIRDKINLTALPITCGQKITWEHINEHKTNSNNN